LNQLHRSIIIHYRQNVTPRSNQRRDEQALQEVRYQELCLATEEVYVPKEEAMLELQRLKSLT
jgi:hypothetical protein